MDARPIAEHFAPRLEYFDIEVTGVRKLDGTPARVRCHRPDAQQLAELLGFLPGAMPPEREDAGAGEESGRERLFRIAPLLIEPWTSIQLPDGEWATPAFSFAADGNYGGRVPGRDLTQVDLGTLGLTLLRLGGYAGGAASSAFLGDRGGSTRSD